MAIVLPPGAAARAEDLTDEKKAAIREMLVLGGEERRAATELPMIVSQMFQLVQPSDEISAEEIVLLQEEIAGTMADAIASGVWTETALELAYPVYHKHFTLEDVRGVSAFYRTEVGQKFVEVVYSSEFVRDMQSIAPLLVQRLQLSDIASIRVRARQGNARAQCELADLYRQGGVLPRDYAEAVKWQSRASERGYPCSLRR